MFQSPFQASAGRDTNPSLCVPELLFQTIPPGAPCPWECVLGLSFAFLGPFPGATNPSGSTAGICWDQRHHGGKTLTEVPFIPLQRPGNVQGFLGRAFVFLPEAADKHRQLLPGAEPANSWHLWMWGRKVWRESWERSGIASQTGVGHEEKPLRGLRWPGRFGWYSQINIKKNWIFRVKKNSRYSWGSLFVLFGSMVLMEEFRCELRG